MHIDSKPLQRQQTPLKMDRCGLFPAEKSSKIWRPWDEERKKEDPKKLTRPHPYKRCHMDQSTHPLQSYISTFKHPVKLYWTKAAYDYMYEAGEKLLRNFPVQATIQVVEDSDSDDSDEDDDDEDDNTLEESLKEMEETPKDRKKSSS